MTTRRRQTTMALAAVLIAATGGCQTKDPWAVARPSRTGGQPAAPAPSAAPGFTLVASGDVLPHGTIIERAKADAKGSGYDFRPMLAGVKPVVARADLAICHLETVYGADGDYTGNPTFSSPPQVAEALAATGYDACSTAANHTLDEGVAGIRTTLDALDRAGVRHVGSARTADEANGVTMMRAGSAKVAHLAYTNGTNGSPLPQGQAWAVNLIDPDRIVADARAARAAGADVVVVSLHWGTAWQDAPDAQQVWLSTQLTASATNGRPDVDLILGTHAHVPQPYQKVNGTWVVYGLGDQIADAMVDHQGVQDPRGNESTIGRFAFAPPSHPGGRWEVTKAEFIPQFFDPGSGRVVNLNAGLDQGAAAGGVRDRIRDLVLSRGAAQDGLVMGK
ncbi:lipoprotein [Streptomyces albiflavescens]|uniref:Lipoprotein n=1 Tax=Streptomyces albiflavescens TaxID=1623582 RepID=A0A917XXA7_9ACTN|nr:CapA family protein [Streptomyces albiflavescens]GGN58096.1 lipoprotein [Streptomyces albiflavescens]